MSMIGPIAQKQCGANGHDRVNKIHYVIEGKGEPVLVIHGFTRSFKGQMDVIKSLSNNFKVIAMDCRGHGQSEKPHDPDAYGMNMIEDHIRLLDHLKIKKAHVYGYSMGGEIAIGIVGFHPERVISPIVGGAGWIPPDQTNDPSPDFSVENFAESLEQGKGLTALWQALGVHLTPKQLEKHFEWFNSTQDPLALAAILRNNEARPTEAQIRSNTIPILALIGEKDPAKKAVDRLDGLMPNLKIVVIPNADHGTALTDPVFNNSLKAFFLENTSSKSGM